MEMRAPLPIAGTDGRNERSLVHLIPNFYEDIFAMSEAKIIHDIILNG
jgi:hypothetical protein